MESVVPDLFVWLRLQVRLQERMGFNGKGGEGERKEKGKGKLIDFRRKEYDRLLSRSC